ITSPLARQLNRWDSWCHTLVVSGPASFVKRFGVRSNVKRRVSERKRSRWELRRSREPSWPSGHRFRLGGRGSMKRYRQRSLLSAGQARLVVVGGTMTRGALAQALASRRPVAPLVEAGRRNALLPMPHSAASLDGNKRRRLRVVTPGTMRGRSPPAISL